MPDLIAPSGISVTTKFHPLTFLLYLCRPRLVLDNGEPMVRPWGKSFIPAEPGEHSLTCYFRYLYLARAMESSTIVSVAPGQDVELQWKARWIIFQPGIWSSVGPT